MVRVSAHCVPCFLGEVTMLDHIQVVAFVGEYQLFVAAADGSIDALQSLASFVAFVRARAQGHNDELILEYVFADLIVHSLIDESVVFFVHRIRKRSRDDFPIVVSNSIETSCAARDWSVC